MADLKRSHFDNRLAQLEKDRASHDVVYKDLRDYLAPYRGVFDGERNSGRQGIRKDTKINNGAPGLASRDSSAGMNSNNTSSARPWFRLETEDRALMELQEVKQEVRLYLHTVEQKLYQIFAKSNFYNMATKLYREIVVFGTAVMSILADFEDVVIFHTFTVGEYYIAQNHRGLVDVLYRRLLMSVSALVGGFGKENVSRHVLDLFNRGNTETLIDVIHAVEPNDTRVPNLKDAKNKAYRSVYYEKGVKEDKFLRVSGFDKFPYAGPRWDTCGADPYGTEYPGLFALGDSKSLQVKEYNKQDGIQRNTNPPIIADAGMKSTGVLNIPGGVSWNPAFGNTSSGAKPLYQVTVPVAEITQDQDVVIGRIGKAFYVDLFLAIASNQRPQDMKAEVAFQIDRERLLMLGPVLSNLDKEWLSIVIERTFEEADNKGILPEAPKILEGQGLKIDYVSALAKAQKAAAIGGMERLSGLTFSWAQGDQSVLDKLDFNQGVDAAGELLDVPPRFIRSDEEALEVTEGRKLVEQQRALLEASQGAADTAETLSKATVSKDNMLGLLTGA